MLKFLNCLFALWLGAGAFGADISGKWRGTLDIKLPDGTVDSQPAWAEFAAKGEAITGSAGGGDSDESSPIEKGSFDGKNLSFQFTGPDGRIYKAALALTDPDELEGSLEFLLTEEVKRGRTDAN